MGKVYQQIVITETKNLMDALVDSNFFKDHEITDFTFAENYFLEKMNEKYVIGITKGNEEEIDFFFTEEEFTKMLQEVVAGTILYDLKEKGLINSYEDEETEEIFFLTEKGKDLIKNLNNTSQD